MLFFSIGTHEPLPYPVPLVWFLRGYGPLLHPTVLWYKPLVIPDHQSAQVGQLRVTNCTQHAVMKEAVYSM